MNTVRTLFLLFILLAIFSNGSIGQSYDCTTKIEIRYGLIILPVEIDGETFDFLFDTGAPTAISEELQEKFNFKVEKTKKQTDSDGHSRRIKYVNIDTFRLAGLSFTNHQASVYDYTANPAINCLEIDGIIGSTSMFLSTWIIDYQNQSLTITDKPIDYNKNTDIKYKSDGQKSIRIDIKTTHSTIKNIKVDYGSVGSLSVPNKIFKVLKDRNEFKKILVSSGFKMGGLFGKKSEKKIYSGIMPKSKIGNVPLDSFELKTGSKGLMGVKILKDYLVTIDGPNKIIRFELYDQRPPDEFETFGIGLGLEKDKIIVFNTLQDSHAEKLGILPGTEIQKLGPIVFDDPSKLCDYMFSKKYFSDSLNIEFVDPSKNITSTKISKVNYYR